MAERGTKATLLAHARSTAHSLAKRATTPQARADICLDLLSDIGEPSLDVFRRALKSLPIDERH